MLHHFEKGEPGKYKYCVDYQVKKKKDYETIFIDAGWELVYCILGQYLWRMKYDNDKPEAFSNNATLMERNKRWMMIFIFTFAITSVVGVWERLQLGFELKNVYIALGLIIQILVTFWLLAIIIFLYAINRQLKKQSHT